MMTLIGARSYKNSKRWILIIKRRNSNNISNRVLYSAYIMWFYHSTLGSIKNCVSIILSSRDYILCHNGHLYNSNNQKGGVICF